MLKNEVKPCLKHKQNSLKVFFDKMTKFFRTTLKLKEIMVFDR